MERKDDFMSILKTKYEIYWRICQRLMDLRQGAMLEIISEDGNNEEELILLTTIDRILADAQNKLSEKISELLE